MKIHLLCLTAALIVLSGCASSERLVRISGGVFSSYSAPRKHRIASEKFRKVRINSPEHRPQNTPMDFSKSIINLWPFFFRSDAYWSLLWPFADFDRYGMAIRPFYNQEGDDFSLLFPLSAWNCEKGSGWVLLWNWNKERFQFFPLGEISRDPDKGPIWFTPFFIRNWEYRKNPSWKNNLVSKEFREYLLFYTSNKREIDTSEYSYLGGDKYTDRMKRMLRYKFQDKKPIPADFEALKACREKLFKTLPVREERECGFFPLFHWVRSPRPDTCRLNIIGPLAKYSSTPKKFEISFLGPIIGWMKKDHYGITTCFNYLPYEKREILSIFLLSGYFHNLFPKKTEQIRALERLNSYRWFRESAKYRPEMEKEYAKAFPGRQLPSYVTDSETMNLHLEEITKNMKFPMEDEYSGGFLPLFNFSNKRESGFWNSPVLLSGDSWSKKENRSFFLSIPLLSMDKQTPDSRTSWYFTPLVYYRKYRKQPRIRKPILDSRELFTEEKNMAELQDVHCAFWLYYHGTDGFYAAKEGVFAATAERLRSGIWKAVEQFSSIKSRKSALKTREERNRKWQTKNKIEHYQKLIEEEKIRMEREKSAKDESSYQSLCRDLQKRARILKFDLPAKALQDRITAEMTLEKLFDQCARLRKVESFGSGLFFRKELYENGDHHWRFLFGLASGQKSGEREQLQILSLLYRRRKEAAKEETVIFPFIVSRRNGNDTSASFMWRLWERHERNGRSGGHILFIPYGE